MIDFKPLLLFLIAIALTIYLPISTSELTRLEVQSVFAPVTRFLVHSRIKTASVFDVVADCLWPMEPSQKSHLLKANRIMHDRLITLSDEVSNLERLLKDTNNHRILTARFIPIPADVLGRNYQHFLDELTVDVGEIDGIKVGMGVVQGGRVLGRIKSVSAKSSTVALLVHNSCKIASCIERNKKQGLLEGGKTNAFSLLCSMKYLFDSGKPNENIAVKLDDRVLTSGTDPVFPSGLFVGTVVNVEKLSTEMFYRVAVKPAIDLSAIYSVVILKPVGG